MKGARSWASTVPLTVFFAAQFNFFLYYLLPFVSVDYVNNLIEFGRIDNLQVKGRIVKLAKELDPSPFTGKYPYKRIGSLRVRLQKHN